MDINQAAIDYVVARAVPIDFAFHAGFGITPNAQEIDKSFHPRAALRLPYFDEFSQPIDFERVRYFDPPIVGGVKKKALRYQQPKGTAPELYLPKVPGLDWAEVMRNPQMPVAITEGEVKSLSATINSGVPHIGLGGVFMWADNKMPIETFNKFDMRRRKIYIVFDSDIDTNAQVQLAESRLSAYLVKRMGLVHRVRLPTGQDGEKQGADDFIAAFGPESYQMALRQTGNLDEVDLRILELNEKVAYLEDEEKIFVLQEQRVMSKAAFTEGSIYSTLKIETVDANGKLKSIGAAKRWLQHPLARRYANTIFQPGGDDIVKNGDGTFLNSWVEQPCKPGDVSKFIELTEYLFRPTMGDDWMWPIKLLAHKAQNQKRKVPLAIMLIGGQGSGKSLWSKMVMEAFGDYGTAKSGADLEQNWNGFIEKSLVAVIDDVSARQMRQNIETLRNWISESKVERIEKYLKNRVVNNYCLFIFTSNYRDAGAFAHDDRRFLVVGAPEKHHDEGDHYQPYWDWINGRDAGAYIYHYLLNFDLDGWTPPATAPVTAEKRMAYEESLSDFAKLARQMREADHNIVEKWLMTAEQWAYNVIGSPSHPDTGRANEVIMAIQHFPIRPWYTADELVEMFPHMVGEMHRRTKGWNPAALPGKVSSELRNQGIKFLQNTENPSGFIWNGDVKQFLIVVPNTGIPDHMTQRDFEAYMSTFGNYMPKIRNVA